MPRPKGARPDLRYREPSVRPAHVSISIYREFKQEAEKAGLSLRDAQEAAMLAYMEKLKADSPE
jgi:hypothetical protein